MGNLLRAALSILVPAASFAAERGALPPEARLPSAEVARAPETPAALPPIGPILEAAPQAGLPSAGVPGAAVPQAQLAAAAAQGGPQAPQGPEGADAARERLFDGERVYAPEAACQTLDEKTVNDLDLMTQGSGLFSIVRGANAPTAFGDQRLKWLLTHPSQDAGEIRRRQEAIAELSQNAALRQAVDSAFQRLGDHAREPLRQHVLSDQDSLKGPLIIIHLLQAGVLAIAALTVLHGGGLRALPQMAMLFLMMSGMPMTMITKLRKQLVNYKAAFALARDASKPLIQSQSPLLRELGRSLEVDNPAQDGPGLSGLAGSLKRMGSPATMTIPDLAWFHGAKTLPYVLSRMRKKRAELARLFGAVGELDALRSLALYGERLGEKGTKPVLRDDATPSLTIKDGHHPFLAAQGGSVANDVRLDLSLGASAGEPNFGVLTGSNMGGKSTYLRMAALLPLLAQTGALVPAAAYEASVLKILSSIDIRDHLASGKSLYDAETDRILALIKAAEIGGYLMVMDEILQGTNPEESSAAQWAVVRHLIRTGNLFFLATHNPKVTELAKIEPRLANFHVEESYRDGKMSFSHRVLPGPATSRNGLLTLETKGFPQDVVDEARRVVEGAKKP